MLSEFAGTLSQRIAISRRTLDRTDSGLTDSIWADILTCRASVINEGAGSEAEGMSFSGMPRLRFTVRADPRVQVDDRVGWRERLFFIRQIVEDPRSPDRLQLRCEEVRA